MGQAGWVGDQLNRQSSSTQRGTSMARRPHPLAPRQQQQQPESSSNTAEAAGGGAATRNLTCAAWLRTLLSSWRSSFSSSCKSDGRQQRTRHEDASSRHGCHAANRSGAATCSSQPALRMPQLPHAAAAADAPHAAVPNPWHPAMPAALRRRPSGRRPLHRLAPATSRRQAGRSAQRRSHSQPTFLK